MRLSIRLLILASLNAGCSVYHNLVPIPDDMAGCVPSPECSPAPDLAGCTPSASCAPADMHVDEDGGADLGCHMICPSVDMAPDLRPSCIDSSTCPSPSPVCSGGKCVQCAPANDMGASSECAMYHAPANLCGPMGGCVQCLSKDDCAQFNETCNLATNACGPCSKHSDCTTGVCKSGGACASPSEVAYVDRDKAACSDLPHTSTPTAPFCQITAAISPSPKPYTVVAGSSTPYNPVSLNTTTGAIGPLTIIGPGRNSAPPATIAGSGAVTPDGVAVQTGSGNAATLTLDGLVLIGAGGATPGAGVRCTVGTGAATVTVLNSYIHNSGGYGVSASSCALTLDANIVGPSNTGGGVSISGGSVTASNNLIVGNGTGGPGVSFSGSVSGTWWFNTVANNSFKTGPTTNPSAFTCSTTGATLPVLQAGIVWGNDKASGASFDSSRCVFTYTDIDDTVTPSGGGNVGNFNLDPMFTTGTLPATSFRIPSGSPCKDKVTSATGLTGGTLPNHDVDGNARPRMSTGGYDCGGSEAP